MVATNKTDLGTYIRSAFESRHP